MINRANENTTASVLDVETSNKTTIYVTEDGKYQIFDKEKGERVDAPDIEFVSVGPDGKLTVLGNKNTLSKTLNDSQIDDITTGQKVDTNGKDVLTSKEVVELLDAKFAKNMDEFKAHLTQKVGPESTWDKVCLYFNRGMIVLGIASVAAGVVAGIVLLSQYVRDKEKEAEDVNNATYIVSQIQTSSLTYTCRTATTRLCAGDSLSQFAGFESVNKPELNTEAFSLTKSATGQITEHTFQSVKSGEIVKKGTTAESPDLTFKVNTDAVRRVACDVAQITYSLVSGAAGVVSAGASGLFDGLGINWGIVILVLIGLVVGGVILAVVMK